MKTNHNIYSNLAFRLAEINLGKTKKNPSVGCIIVKNDSVISSGVTSINGRPHAEFNALKKKISFNKSNMYVTLEPCTHYGKTPPCTYIIKKKKIKNIFYSFYDPDERTHKKVKKFLKNSVKLKKIDIENKNFYKSYYLNKINKLPLIDAKIAISKDFFTINKSSKWITNLRSRRVSHLIRSKYDCIISTSNSINKDNSLLNCRINGMNHMMPKLIIIDRYLKIKKNLKLFQLTKKRKTTIVTTSNNRNKISFLKKKNIKIIKLRKLENKSDFKLLFEKLFISGSCRILVESGLVFIVKLFKFRLINDLYVFKSNTLLKKNGYNNVNTKFLKNLVLKNRIKVNLKNDNLYKIRFK